MKLTKSEAHFRTKIIQELHLKKHQQQMIDKFAKNKKRSYCDLYYTIRLTSYLSGIELSTPNVQNSLSELCNAIADCAAAANDVVSAFIESFDDLVSQYNRMYEIAREKGYFH